MSCGGGCNQSNETSDYVLLTGMRGYRWHVRQRGFVCANCDHRLERWWLGLDWCGVPYPIWIVVKALTWRPVRMWLPRCVRYRVIRLLRSRSAQGCRCCLTVKRRWPFKYTPTGYAKIAAAWMLEHVSAIQWTPTLAESKCPKGKWRPMQYYTPRVVKNPPKLTGPAPNSGDNQGEMPRPRTETLPDGDRHVALPDSTGHRIHPERSAARPDRGATANALARSAAS